VHFVRLAAKVGLPSKYRRDRQQDLVCFGSTPLSRDGNPRSSLTTKIVLPTKRCRGRFVGPGAVAVNA
jgi:hypothetical protein